MNDLADVNLAGTSGTPRPKLSDAVAWARNSGTSRWKNVAWKPPRISTNAGPPTHGAARIPDVGNKVPPTRDLPQVRSAIDAVDGSSTGTW